MNPMPASGRTENQTPLRFTSRGVLLCIEKPNIHTRQMSGTKSLASKEESIYKGELVVKSRMTTENGQKPLFS